MSGRSWVDLKGSLSLLYSLENNNTNTNNKKQNSVSVAAANVFKNKQNNQTSFKEKACSPVMPGFRGIKDKGTDCSVCCVSSSDKLLGLSRSGETTSLQFPCLSREAGTC